MTIREAKHLGSKKIMGYTGFLLLLWLIILLVTETKGDFANGFLFFLEDMLNNYLWLIIITVLLTSYFLGRRAGKNIIIERKNIYFTALKYASGIVTAMFVCIASTGFLQPVEWRGQSFMNKLIKFFLRPLFTRGFIVLIPFFFLWLLATNSLKKFAKNETSDSL